MNKVINLINKKMNLFETLENDLKPENSILSKAIDGYKKQDLLEKEAELKAIAEEATALIIDPSSPHFRNYTLMYCLGYQDRELKERSNLLNSIKS
jgi:hypothetical protein